MVDLFSQLSKRDKKILENYIYFYGVNKNDFIGLEKWLSHWNHANQTLYKLLGNKLIHKVDFSYKKSRDILKKEIRFELLNHDFLSIYETFLKNGFPKYLDKKEKSYFAAINSIVSMEALLTNACIYSMKFKKENSRKMLQIQVGTKPMRALSKILDYFKEEFYNIDKDYKEKFEDFRIKHSMLFNDKNIVGTLCISIHPMDYLTMSDNNSDWSSCMSWADDGCYKIGSVEMMNSNNVLCCYLESKIPYDFTPVDKDKNEFTTWNNKKWRVLAYYTKDIIMSGKAYPYHNDNFSKFVIAEIRKLAKENLNRTFSFGPELYQDMKHIKDQVQMNYIHHWLRTGDVTKSNIIWDTKGMYNDMINDSDEIYWCYRNKVPFTKIINVSGKSSCLCCGKPTIEESEWEESYNDRFDNVDSFFCSDCRNNIKCHDCGTNNMEEKVSITIVEEDNDDDSIFYLCENCFKESVKYCPCCGKPMYINNCHHSNSDYLYISKKLEKVVRKKTWIPEEYFSYSYVNDRYDVISLIRRKEEYNPTGYFIEPIYLCNECWVKKDKLFPLKKKRKTWATKDGYDIIHLMPPRAWAQKYRYINLKSVSIKDFKEKFNSTIYQKSFFAK